MTKLYDNISQFNEKSRTKWAKTKPDIMSVDLDEEIKEFYEKNPEMMKSSQD